MKKVLIVYASAGDGHKKSAEAVHASFLRLKGPDVKVTLIDSLDYTNRLFRRLYRGGYIFLIKYVPTLWGLIYYMLDSRFFFTLNKPLRRAVNAFNTSKFQGFLKDEKFDLIVSTHFLPTEVVTSLKGRGEIDSQLLNIVTDFKPHLFWRSALAERYAVAADITKELLAKAGIDEARIKVLGIPIGAGFRSSLSRREARGLLGLHQDRFTILVMGGGFGVGPIEAAVMKIQELELDCQIIAVCGHNERLLKRLRLLSPGFKKKVLAFGFSSNMSELMSASDVMISKVGGLSVSEALAKRLPVISINPIPGQEMRNAAFLFDKGIGFKMSGTSGLNKLLRELCERPRYLEGLRSIMAKFARPESADNITRLSLGLIE